MSTENSGSSIQIQNVSKIFGNTSKEALDAIKNKLVTKQEALEKYNSVIGVSDVSFDINPGEIFSYGSFWKWKINPCKAYQQTLRANYGKDSH